MAKIVTISADGTYSIPNAVAPTGTQNIVASSAGSLPDVVIVNANGTYAMANIDLTQPVTTLAINGGAVATNVATVLLTLPSATAAYSRFSDDNVTWSDWEEYAAEKVWTLSGDDGTKTVYLQLKNVSGVQSDLYSASIIYDTTVPVGIITTQGSYTLTQNVSLSVSATAGSGSAIESMRFSNDDATWSAWEAYATSKAWTLAGGDGSKTIYTQFRDVAGNISASASASIELFTSLPNISLDSTPAAVTNAPTGTFTFSTTTPNTTFRASIDGAAAVTVTSPYTTPALANGLHSIRIVAVHVSGAESSPATYSWTINTLAVVATLSGIPASPTIIDSADITVAGSGVTHYKYRVNGAAWSAETAVADHIALSSLDGAQTLDVIGKNGDGLWQIIPTTARWTVVVRVFNTAQSFTTTLEAELDRNVLFDYEQPLTFTLEADTAETDFFRFSHTLTASFPDGTIAKEFDTSQSFTHAVNAQFGEQIIDTNPFESSQSFTLAFETDFLAGTAYQAQQSFGFTLAAAAVADVLFDTAQSFGYGLTANYTSSALIASEQPFTFSQQADFMVYQSFDSVQSLGLFFDAILTGQSAATAYADTVAYAVNTRTLEGSEYTNYPFNSLAMQGSDMFAAGAGGIYKLSGSQDITTPIVGRLLSGISDFGSRRLKIFDDVHLFLRTNGALEIAVITDETKRRTYDVVARDGQEGAHTKRVKLARGIRARSVQLEITTVAGSSLDLSEIQLNYDETQRT